MKNELKLIKPMYPCQDVPVIAFGTRCPKPCLYCDLRLRKFSNEEIIASDIPEILEKIVNYKGAYFSAITDCLLPENRETTHYLIEEIWKRKSDFVPLVVTKQIIPQKTIDLFVANKKNVVVQISVPSLNEEIVSILEPGAASIKDRLSTIEQLTKQGVKVIVVIMTWFNIYKEGESIEELPQKLAKLGVKKCIVGTAVLPEKERDEILAAGDDLIVQSVNKMTEIRKATTKIGYTLPLKERLAAFEKLNNACAKFGIQSMICTADNSDLIGKTKLRLCTKFEHRNFKK